MNQSTTASPLDAKISEAIRSGDESAFANAVSQHRLRLQAHCYQLLGSTQDAEDLVQETFLRAWNKRESFEGRSSLRGWLYKIATNACLDAIERDNRRAKRVAPIAGIALGGETNAAEVAWLQPYPDKLLEGIASSDPSPEDSAIALETMELAYIVAIQHLSPQARTVLILRDVLGWPANDCAELLDISVASVTSSLQRARETMHDLMPPKRSDWPSAANAERAEREFVDRFIKATQDGDGDAFVEMMTEDARFSMPPEPAWWVGNRRIVDVWEAGGFGGEDWGEMTAIPTRANGQLALLNYVKRPGTDFFAPMSIDVLRMSEGKMSEIVTFPPEQFGLFDAPQTLPG